MEFWTALGIEQTKDIDAITAAYHEQLKLVNPEDKPEEFKQLRAEYEAALKYAKADEQSDAAKTPIDLWLDKVDAVYSDFSRRRNVDEWKALLSDEVCQGLDSRIDARNALLRYMMEHYYLTKDVYGLLNKEFSLVENKAELYEIFPEEFIDNAVISGIDGDSFVPYDMFPADTKGDVDAYIHLVFKVTREIRAGDFEAADATFDTISKTGVVHPYTDMLKARMLFAREQYSEIPAVIDPLVEQYPDHNEFLILRAECLRRDGKFEEALPVYEKIVSTEKTYALAQQGKATCLTELGRLEDAKDVYYDMSDLFPDNHNIRPAIDELNKRLIEKYSAMEAEGTLDYDSAYKYAWCCYQSEMNDKALELLASITPETTIQRCDYENLFCKLDLTLEKYEEALEHAKLWEKAIRELEDKDDEETREQKKRLWRSIHIQAHALMCLDRFDEALAEADRSFAEDQTKVDPLETRRRIFSVRRDSEKAIAEAERIAQIKPSFMAYWILGLEQYDAGMKQAAFNSFGSAIEHDRNAAAYIQRARILCDCSQYDDAESIIKELKDAGIDDDSVHVIDAFILEGREKKDEALALYREIIERYEAEDSDHSTSLMWEVYYNAAVLEQGNLTPEELVAMCDKGLAEKDDYSPLLGFKAFLFDVKLDKKQEALDTYHKIIELYPRHSGAYRDIGNIYFDDLNEFGKAAEYYEKQLTINESARLHAYAGLSYQYLFDFESADRHYQRALEIEPDDLLTLGRQAMLREYQYDYEAAYALHKRCFDLAVAAGDENKVVRRNLARILARLGRHDEAIEMRLENLSKFGDDEDASAVIELCVESGQADRAEQFVEQFYAAKRINDDQRSRMTRDILLLRRDYKKYVKTLEALPDDSFFKYSCLSAVYRRAGKFKKAVECYRKCDEMRGERDELANCRLYCYKWMGDKELLEAATAKIQSNVDRLEERRWQYSLYLTKMALIRTATDRPDEALPFIEKAMTGPMCNTCRYSKCKDAYVALAEYYCAKGEYDKAIETCREGLKIAPDEYDFVAIPELVRKYHKSKLKKENRK